MAYELHGLLAGNVSIVTGENIKPSYGGDNEAFLRKVITPIYRVIDQVYSNQHMHNVLKIYPLDFSSYVACSDIRRPGRAKTEKLLTQRGAIMMI